MISSSFSINRFIHFKPVPTSEQPLPEPLVPRSRERFLAGDLLPNAAVRRPGRIRAEIVARARQLAEDPNYPPLVVIRHIAGQILVGVDGASPQS